MPLSDLYISFIYINVMMVIIVNQWNWYNFIKLALIYQLFSKLASEKLKCQ